MHFLFIPSRPVWIRPCFTFTLNVRVAYSGLRYGADFIAGCMTRPSGRQSWPHWAYKLGRSGLTAAGQLYTWSVQFSGTVVS